MIQITVVAVSDLERLKNFLLYRNPRVAARALETIWSTIDQLEAFPRLGKPTDDPDIREVFTRFGNSGYLIRYIPDFTTNVIVVTRIWHSREDRP